LLPVYEDVEMGVDVVCQVLVFFRYQTGMPS